MKHVCLFDIDGTLISSGGAGKAAMELALCTEFGVAELLDQVPYSGRTDRAIGHDLLRLHGIEGSAENWDRLVAVYLGHLPESLHRHPGRILPGIDRLLDQLRARGDVAVGLLTGNIRAGARIKLGHFGIFEHFAFGAFGDEHLCRDDVARAALSALRDHLNGSAHGGQLWVIGDTPLDIRCARAIGAQVVAVSTGLHSTDELAKEAPDLVLVDFADPQCLLGLLTSEGASTPPAPERG